MREFVEYLNERYDDGRNVPGWEVSPASFKDAAEEFSLKIESRNDLPHEKGEVWQFVEFYVSGKRFLTRTAW